MTKKLALLTIVSMMVLTGCAKEYKSAIVQAQVTEKDYDPPKTTTKYVTRDGKRVKKVVTEKEEYEVTLSYNGVIKEINSKSLYDRVAVGQYVDIKYTEGLDEKGKVVSKSISLP